MMMPNLVSLRWKILATRRTATDQLRVLLGEYGESEIATINPAIHKAEIVVVSKT
jgi:hypothetical protein